MKDWDVYICADGLAVIIVNKCPYQEYLCNPEDAFMQTECESD